MDDLEYELLTTGWEIKKPRKTELLKIISQSHSITFLYFLYQK